jgi:probable DNA repair protein
MSFTSHTVTICSTARLVRGMHLHRQQTQLASSKQQWQAIEAYTLQQWLDQLIENVTLLGLLPSDALPIIKLSEVAEAFLWEQAITSCLAKHEAAALFDVRALAKSAIEANQLMCDWRISEAEINHQFITQETRQFLRWRHTFQTLCAQQNAIDAANLTALQIALIEQHEFSLPQHITLAGFDRITPLERQLFEHLKACGVQVEELAANTISNARVEQYALNDSNAECRVEVAWAKQKLAENPQAQLAIISPVLGNIRRELADLLDDTFHPETLHASQYEAPRCYDFSLGLTLTEYPLVHSALRLLRFASTKTNISFKEVTPILQDVYWSSEAEFDARAQLDAYLRQRLNANYSLEALINQANKLLTENVQLTALIAHLNVIVQFQTQPHKRQLPSMWVAIFVGLLDALNWAKSRALSSYEYQMQQSFQKRLAELGALDSILGNIAVHEALQKLVELCNSAMFQPEAIGVTHIQLLGLLETPALQLDAIWALNMNDQHWPPPVKLNPLLPAELQRNRSIPNSSASVQTEFATLVQRRLMLSAPEIVFSYALKEDERELRPSPLLMQGESVANAVITVESIQTLAEKLAQPATMEVLGDNMAPAVSDEEKVRGGVKLFATQAICPAWAFYQYRLGANKLETPIDGLDNMSRGSLLHKVLQLFWLDCESLGNLKAMSPQQCISAIDVAIEKSIAALAQEIGAHLPPQVLQIERQRLSQLMQYWLALELERADFEVRDCEKKFPLEIEGLSLNLTIDRIDALVDGGIVVIDYKTSSLVTNKSWADDRITEPQLPIYAALALKDEQVVAVCLAKIRTDETKFVGLSEEEGILPGVTIMSKVRGEGFKRFESWDALLQHWDSSLKTIAQEIKAGVAAVTFQKEIDLEYCDVKPLLRLPERMLQFEQMQIVTKEGSH